MYSRNIGSFCTHGLNWLEHKPAAKRKLAQIRFLNQKNFVAFRSLLTSYEQQNVEILYA